MGCCLLAGSVPGGGWRRSLGRCSRRPSLEPRLLPGLPEASLLPLRLLRRPPDGHHWRCYCLVGGHPRISSRGKPGPTDQQEVKCARPSSLPSFGRPSRQHWWRHSGLKRGAMLFSKGNGRQCLHALETTQRRDCQHCNATHTSRLCLCWSLESGGRPPGDLSPQTLSSRGHVLCHGDASQASVQCTVWV